MRKARFFFILIYIQLAAGSVNAAVSFNVLDFGVRPDGRTLCTAGIQRAIDACSKAGGGTLYFPSGRYLTGSLFLRSRITIEIEAGATLLFDSDIEHTPVIDGSWEGLDRKVYASLFTGVDLQDITITGRGTLDGQGKPWWDAARQTMALRKSMGISEREPENPPGSALKWGRPKMIDLYRCRNIIISGLTITNSPAWTIHPIYCRDIDIHQVRIIQPYDSPNTDGIDPESCADVRITGCFIDCGDDCIALKSGYNAQGRAKGIPCEDVIIANCTFAHGRSAVGIGSEMSGGVRNVTVTGCIFRGTLRGLRVKTGRGRGGVVEGLLADNIIMDSVGEGISIDMYYDGHDTTAQPVTEQTPFFRNIRYFNIIGRHLKQAINIDGLPEAPVQDISLGNIFMEAERGARCNFTKGLRISNVQIRAERGAPFAFVHAVDLVVQDTAARLESVVNRDGGRPAEPAAHLSSDSRNPDAGVLATQTAAPAIPGAIPSPLYRVCINGVPLFVEKIAKFDVPLHFGHFVFRGPAPVRVEIICSQRINRYSISPLGFGIRGEAHGDTLVFNLDQPRYLVVRINEGEYLFLTADRPEPGAPDRNKVDVTSVGIDTSGGSLVTGRLQIIIDSLSGLGHASTLYFPAGIYRMGQLNLRSHVSLYLESGALLKGSTDPRDYRESLLRLDGVSDMSIRGAGTIDGSGWDGLRTRGARGLYLVYLSDCRDIRIEGVILRDPCFWNTRIFRSKRVRLRNIKILNDRPAQNWVNTDGVDFDSSTDGLVDNAIMHTGDDNIVVKGLDEKMHHGPARIRFNRIVGLSNSAAAKIGTETLTPSMRHIEFRNMDIVQCKRAIVISGFDSSTIRDVVFRNIQVENMVFEGKEGPRLIDIEITDHSWRACSGRCRISKIRIDGLRTFFPLDGVSSRIVGRTPQFSVNDVRIRNFDVMGTPVKTKNQAHLTDNRFVSGIRFD